MRSRRFQPPKFNVGDGVTFVNPLTRRPLPGRGRVKRVGSGNHHLYRIVADDTSLDLGWFGESELRPVAAAGEKRRG